MKKIILLLIVILHLPFVLFSRELTLMHDKGGTPNYQPYFEEISKLTEKEIGVSYNSVSFPSTDVFIANLRPALKSKRAPGIFNYWSTWRTKPLIDSGLIANLTALWDKRKNEYDPGIRDAFTFDNKVYCWPWSMDYWVVWYNKDVFKKYNLTPPGNWSDFMAIADKLKNNGIPPLTLSVQQRWPAFIMFEELIMGESSQLYNDLMIGKVKYTDKKVIKVFKLWKNMIDQGYFTDPSLDLFSDAPRLFNQDKLAMAVMGTWYHTGVLTSNGVDPSKIGVFILPSHNPAAGKNIIFEAAPLCVSQNTPNKEKALKLADWYMSPRGNAALPRKVGSYPTNLKADTFFLTEDKVNLLKTINSGGYTLVNRFWEATPTPICEAAVDIFAKFILDTSKLDEVLDELDKVSNKYWASN